MQTFLPVESFKESAYILDKKRCFKQVVEAKQILNTIMEGKKGWANHPAVSMWRGYETALIEYYNVFWETCKEKWGIKFVKLAQLSNIGKTLYPSWLGDEKFHASHRSNLLRKNPIYYGQFGWSEKSDLPYIWPTKLSVL